MARTKQGRRRILPFRIPVFRVFYSLTYTGLYFLTLLFLAVSPVTMIYSSLDQSAYQYTFMIGGVYVLFAFLATLIYSSRLYTNRRVLSDIGKPYIPIEDGEVAKMVRKMIVKQLERSAIVAWESRPRDLYGEILLAAQQGILSASTESVDVNNYTIGSEIRLDPANPPWGDIQHAGWSSPSHRGDNRNPNVQFADVIAELPNLIEARAVSLVPADPTMTPVPDEPRAADPAVVDVLTRPTNMPVRDYLTQLAYLGLIEPPDVGQRFVSQYEKARFGFAPVSLDEFNRLMATFAELLAGMFPLDAAIVDEIHAQTRDMRSIIDVRYQKGSFNATAKQSPHAPSPASSLISPVTAREVITPQLAMPYFLESAESQESLGSVIRHSYVDLETPSQGRHDQGRFYTTRAFSSSTLPSDAGSVLVHDTGRAG